MSAAPIVEPAEAAAPGVDPVLTRLAEVHDLLIGLVAEEAATAPVTEAMRIDRLAQLERLQAGVEALKCVEIVGLARSRTVEHTRLGVHPRRLERGIAEEIALACRVGPTEGSRRLHTARDLVLDMPLTLGSLARGEIHAGTARRITDQLSHLDRATRTQVDQVLATKRLAEKSPKEAETAAQRAAYAADPVGSTRRASAARHDRRVTLRPAPDTMSLLTGLLPVEQGVACLAALDAAWRQARAHGDERTRGQVMADTLVTRLTGLQQAEGTGFEVGLVMPLDTLVDPDSPTPAEVPGMGVLPAGLVRDLLANAEARSWWRRLFTRPTRSGGRLVVDLDQRRRRFSGWLAELIRWRDLVCRDPFCGAPIRHLDHIRRHTDGGPTDASNGRGVCERGNYVRELPGWTVRLSDPDDHTVITITPTGHQYTSNPPEPP